MTATGTGEQIFPIVDKRRMEPPSDPSREVAYINFSGVLVDLHGVDLRKVLKDICPHRCTDIHPGQKRPPAGQPVVERIVIDDMTKPLPGQDGVGQ